MNSKSVYKSETGKKMILDHYKKVIKTLDVAYQERYIQTSFGETYILEAGNSNAPTILLFHGSCSNSTMWFGDIEELAQGFHVISVDIIGEAGNSAENRLDLNSDDYAHWIKELIDQLNIEKVMLMGNSYGGWMSLKFATVYPQCVSKIVLIATSGIMPARLSFIFKSIMYTLQGKRGLKKLNQTVFGTNDIPEEVLEVSNMIVQNFKPMMGSLPEYKDEDLQKLSMALLYIAGENDATAYADRVAKRLSALIPHSEVQFIENCGHVIYNAMDRVIPFLST